SRSRGFSGTVRPRGAPRVLLRRSARARRPGQGGQAVPDQSASRAGRAAAGGTVVDADLAPSLPGAWPGGRARPGERRHEDARVKALAFAPVDFSKPGGLETHVLEVSRCLEARGHEVHVFGQGLERIPGVRVATDLRPSDYDIVHVHAPPWPPTI